MKIVLLTIAAVLIVTPAFGQKPSASYRYEEFRYPEARETYLYSINDEGEIVGAFRKALGDSLTLFIFDRGEFRAGPTIPAPCNDGSSFEPASFNNAGEIALQYSGGACVVQGEQTRTYVVDTIYGLNNGGVGVGEADDEAVQLNLNRTVTLVRVPADVSGSAVATDINDKAQVVGWYESGTGRVGFLSGGKKTTAIQQGEAPTELYFINDHGIVLGKGFDWFLWRKGKFTAHRLLDHPEFGAPDTTGARVTGFNNDGTVVGWIPTNDPGVSGFVGNPIRTKKARIRRDNGR